MAERVLDRQMAQNRSGNGRPRVAEAHLEYVRCNLCGADDAFVRYPGTAGDRSAPSLGHFACTNVGYGIHPPIVQCRQCHLVYANPRVAADWLLAAYTAVEDPTYVAERQGRELTFQRHLDHLGPYVEIQHSPRLLDVGCHIGVFVELAQARGWEAWGIEPSRWAVEQGRRRQLNIIQGTVSDAPFPDGYFDVVTLWDVIEHLADPLGDMRQVNRLLRPGGLVCIHTMDVESWFARLMGRRWPWLMEMHLYYFSRSTLAALVQRAGFQVVDCCARGRVLRLGYVVSHLKPYSRPLARVLEWGMQRLEMAHLPVPLNFGDLITLYARKG